MEIADILVGESSELEFKFESTTKNGGKGYLKTVIAFSNGNGGKIYFGIEDKTKKVIGINNFVIFEEIDALTNAICNACVPQINPYVYVQTLTGKQIIVVEITKGAQTPYYYRKEGPLDGVYIRVAGTTRKAELYQIKELIMKGKNSSWDLERTDVELSEADIDSFCNKMTEKAIENRITNEEKKLVKKLSLSNLLAWQLIHKDNGKYFASPSYLLLEGSQNTYLYPDSYIQCAEFSGQDILTRIIEFCHVERSRSEIQKFCGIKSRDYFRVHILKPLLESGNLVLTIPNKPNSKYQKYKSVKN